MEIPLNAMEEDGGDARAPVSAAPMRGNSVSLSSILSSSSEPGEYEEGESRGQDPQPQQHQHDQRFESNVAPIAVPQQQPPHRPRLRAGLSNLMNSPMDEDVTMQDPRGHFVGTMSVTIEPSDPPTPVPMRQEAEDTQPQVQEQAQNGTAPEAENEHVHKMEVDSVEEGNNSSSRSTSDSPVSARQRKPSLIEINIQSVVLNDQDLEKLKVELQGAIQKYLIAEAKGDSGGGPPTKRQKKGKNTRKAKPTVPADESIAEIQRCIDHLNQKVGAQFESSTVLGEVVQFCLTFCRVLSEKDSIEKTVVQRKKPSSPEGSSVAATSEIDVDYDATLAALVQKPLYYHLLSVVRRAISSCSEQDAGTLLSQVLEWCFAPSAADWMWVMAFIGQADSYAMVEFLFHELVFSQAGNEAAGRSIVSLIEYLVLKNPAQLVDIVRDLVEDVASDGVEEVNGKRVAWVVNRLVSVATEFPVFLRACDDSMQFFVSKELVTSLASKLYLQCGEDESLSARLITLLEKRSAELPYSGFQLIVLLQRLSVKSSSATTNELSTQRAKLAEDAFAFQDQVLALAERDESCVFVRGISRYLPYICQSALRGLRSSEQKEPSSSASFGQWQEWLELIARHVSKAEVTQQLIEADLMLSEMATTDLPATTTAHPQDLQLCALLSSILTPLSVDYVHFVKEMMGTCNASAPRGRQRRVLAILQALLRINQCEVQSSEDQVDQLPIELSANSELTIEDAIDQLLCVRSWSQSWKSFELWKGTQGVNFWEGFVDLSCSQDPEVASRALELVTQTPFTSLEDPVWQYRCLRKLTTVFFHLLRQYRAEVVHAGSQPETLAEASNATQGRLEKLKVALFRLLALDGGVAHYSSSVYSTFVSLWIDTLFSTTSPTSIPTHFPNRINSTLGQSGENDRLMIRSERTISSKCTNLQSSKVITQFPETLVYRKALDSSWEREMDAAHTCCMYATDLVFQLMCTSVSTGRAATGGGCRGANFDNDEYVERKLKAVVNLLLERAIPCCGITSDDVYKETLPNRSSFDMDLRIEQWLNHFPAFLPLLRAAVTTSASVNSSQSLRLVPLIKSALIVLLGHWNSVKGELSRENMDVPPYMRNRNQLALTCELVQILRLTGWLPAPLGRTAELLPLTSPADIRGILFSCWFYLCDHPPSETSGPTPASSRAASPTSATSSPAVSAAAGGSGNHANVPLEFYLVPLRKALHNNVRTIGAKYPLYMC